MRPLCDHVSWIMSLISSTVQFGHGITIFNINASLTSGKYIMKTMAYKRKTKQKAAADYVSYKSLID